MQRSMGMAKRESLVIVGLERMRYNVTSNNRP